MDHPFPPPLPTAPWAPSLPPPLPDALTLESIVSAALIADFGLAKAGPKWRPGSSTDQQRDYVQKITSLADEIASLSGHPTRIVDLLGERPDFVLARRCDARSGRLLTAASRNAYRRIVRSFCGWLRTSNRLAHCPSPLVMTERETRHAPVFIEADPLGVLVAALAADDRLPARRLIATVFLSIDMGARCSDLLSLEVDSIDRGSGLLELRTKGSNEQRLPVSPQSIMAIDRYLELRTGTSRALFLTDDGTEPLGRKPLGSQLRRWLTKLGIRQVGSRGLSFHALRRTFVRDYRRAGRSEQEVIAMTGWTPEYAHQVIGRYDQILPAELREVHATSSPLVRFLAG